MHIMITIEFIESDGPSPFMYGYFRNIESLLSIIIPKIILILVEQFVGIISQNTILNDIKARAGSCGCVFTKNTQTILFLFGGYSGTSINEHVNDAFTILIKDL